MMQELIDTLGSTLRQTTFATGHHKSCTPHELRDKYRASPYLLNPTAKPQVPEHLFTELSICVRKLLSEFIVNDRIGSGVASLANYDKDISVDEFTLSLIRGAAIIGPEDTARLLLSWKDSESLRYRIHFVLWGAHFPGSFALEDGASIMKLPNDRDELRKHLPFPDSVMGRHRDMDFSNRAKVSVECEAVPPLWAPRKDGAPLKSTWTARKLFGLPVDQFCQALSVSCAQFVSWKVYWLDFGDLVMFSSSPSSATLLPTHSFDSMITEFSPAQLTQSHFEDTFDILAKLQTAKGRLDIAIARWRESKRPNATLSDKLIEIRIALEALYLRNTDRGLGFHLATRGAWHLGADFNERREYQQILRDAYRLGSDAVHASGVEYSEKNGKLLADAQELCRKGILKRLDETEEPKWNELILGREG